MWKKQLSSGVPGGAQVKGKIRAKRKPKQKLAIKLWNFLFIPGRR